MQLCLFWSSRLRIARWKMTISAFSPSPTPPLPWKFVLTHSSHFRFCKDVTLPCTQGLFYLRRTKRHRSIKPVNGTVSSHLKKSIKVSSSHFVLAVSHMTTFCTKKKKKKPTTKQKTLCLSASSPQYVSGFGVWNGPDAGTYISVIHSC